MENRRIFVRNLNDCADGRDPVGHFLRAPSHRDIGNHGTKTSSIALSSFPSFSKASHSTIHWDTF